MLAEASLADAKLALSTLQIETTNLLFAYHCRELGVRCVVHAFDASLIGELTELGVEYLLVPKVDGALRQQAMLAELERNPK